MDGDEARAIFRKLDELSAGQAALKATVEVSLKQHSSEIKALFSYRNEHEKRIAAIERDYVAETAMRQCQDERGREHREVARKVDCVRTNMHRWTGGAAVVVVLAGLGVAVAWKMLG